MERRLSDLMRMAERAAVKVKYDRWTRAQWRYIVKLMEKGKPYQEDSTKMAVMEEAVTPERTIRDRNREIAVLREALKESLELTGAMFDLLIEGVDNPKLPELRAKFEEAKRQFAKVIDL